MILKVGRRHIHQGELIALTRHGNLKPFAGETLAVGFAGEHLHSGRLCCDVNGMFFEAAISETEVDKLLKKAKKK